MCRDCAYDHHIRHNEKTTHYSSHIRWNKNSTCSFLSILWGVASLFQITSKYAKDDFGTNFPFLLQGKLKINQSDMNKKWHIFNCCQLSCELNVWTLEWASQSWSIHCFKTESNRFTIVRMRYSATVGSLNWITWLALHKLMANTVFMMSSFSPTFDWSKEFQSS